MAKSILNVECTYNGLSVARSGVTTIRFKAPFGEIVNYVNILGLIGLKHNLQLETMTTSSRRLVL